MMKMDGRTYLQQRKKKKHYIILHFNTDGGNVSGNFSGSDYR